MKLYLVRHGETQRNREHLVQGQSSHNLTELGVRQALAAAKALGNEGITAIFASPLVRAVETARLIGGELGLHMELAPGLEEMDTGELDGLTPAEMRSRYPEFMSRWSRDAGSAQLPGGESLSIVQERAWRALEAIAKQHGDGTVVAVSHNFTICTLVCKTLDIPLSSFRRFRVDLGSISAIELTDEQARLVLLNSASHLARLEPQHGAAG